MASIHHVHSIDVYIWISIFWISVLMLIIISSFDSCKSWVRISSMFWLCPKGGAHPQGCCTCPRSHLAFQSYTTTVETRTPIEVLFKCVCMSICSWWVWKVCNDIQFQPFFIHSCHSDWYDTGHDNNVNPFRDEYEHADEVIGTCLTWLNLQLLWVVHVASCVTVCKQSINKQST